MTETSSRIRLALLVTAFALACGVPAADERVVAPASGETVTIQSAEAWEDETPDVIHFRGNFQLNTNEWQVTSDQATLYGKLDDPETVILTGSPAEIMIQATSRGERRAVSGEARRIVYERASNRIILEGEARITSDDSILRGGKIGYEIDSDRIVASGDGGIRIRIDTEGPL